MITAATTNRVAPVRAASAEVPVTQVPTGKVNDHQAGPNGRRSRAARTVKADARHAHSRAKPQSGTPRTTPRTTNPVAYGAGSTDSAAVPSRFAAVIACPSGPSTIQSVGTAAAAPTVPTDSRCQIIVITTSAATRLNPNIA
jgi:hypothetical protein